MENWNKLVTTELRKERLHDSAAIDLFATMPDKIVAAIERSFLANDSTGKDAKKVLEYLVYESFISRAINRKAGSGVAFQYLYNKYRFSPVDKYFCDCKAGHQIYKRLVAMQFEIPRILREQFADQEKIIIYNVGSAQGLDIIEALHDNPDLAAKCFVYNIDPDEVSLAQGWDKIVAYGLEKCFELVPHELQEVPRRDVDFIVASGLLCPIPLKKATVIVKRVLRTHLRDGGIILYNATTLNMITCDPLCHFLMSIGGWNMDYKSEEEILSIAKKSKLEYIEHFFDDLRYNCCVVARK